MNSNDTIIEDNESPYCKECEACGHEGCCSPVLCKFKGECAYGESYLVDLKCSYQSWETFYNTIYHDLPQEFKERVDELWCKMIDRWYNEEQKESRIKEVMRRIDMGGEVV